MTEGFRSGALMLAAIALAACAPTPQPPPAAPVTAVQTVSSPPPDSNCAARGGTVRPVCRSRALQCVLNHSDVGKPCRDRTDCAGRCLAADTNQQPGKPVTGQCAATSDPCGCFQEVRGGVAMPALCVD